MNQKFDFRLPYKTVPIKHNPKLLQSEQGIIAFVNSFYYSLDDTDFSVYKSMINTAVRTNNKLAVEGLRKGIDFHDPMMKHV